MLIFEGQILMVFGTSLCYDICIGQSGLFSFFGIRKEECMTLAKNARATMGVLFAFDPAETTDEEIAGIFEKAYR